MEPVGFEPWWWMGSANLGVGQNWSLEDVNCY